MSVPQIGQKTIPLKDWHRFLRMADWWDRTFGHREPGALPAVPGQSVLVKTPEGGIAARDGTTVYSATCTKCVPTESATAGEKTIHETEEELQVYNVADQPVPGSVYVETVLTPNGTREAVPIAGLVAFQIDGAYTNATVLDCAVGVWNSSTHNYAYTGAAAKCIDRRANVPDADADATGVGYYMPSDTHGQIIFIVDLDCPNE
jgi:hypothetical protein